MALALIASFMVAVDGTIVNLALAPLGSQLGASRSELEWTVNAYTLTFAAVMLGAGAITDIVGAKRTFVAGLVTFTASSGACALAGSMLELNVARLVQGAGAALLLPSALVLATAGAPGERERHRLVGRWAAAGGLGMAAGPLLGGMLVAAVNWRAVFAVNVVVGLPALAWSLRAMPVVAGRVRRLDLAGMLSATALIGGLVFALIEAPARGWGSVDVVVAFTLACVGLVSFTLVERTTRTPLLPVGIYRDRTFVATALQGALFNFAFYGLLFALGLMLQQGRGVSAIAAGVLLLPLTALIPLGAVGGAALVRRIGRRAVLASGESLLVLTLLAVAWTSRDVALWPLVLALIPAGLSAGVLVPTMISQSLTGVRPALHGAASSVFNTSRQIGAAIGIATFGPLLGESHDIAQGFTACVIVAASATAVALVLTLAGRTRRRGTMPASELSIDAEPTMARYDGAR
jgi:DHA2 family methylenomycin A resistance protein-like MFS transporter